MEEPLEDDTSGHAEEVSAGGGTLVREISSFKLRIMPIKVGEIPHG